MAAVLPPDGRLLLHAVSAWLVRCGADQVRRVIVFGSQAKGTARPDSDIDVLLVIEPAAQAWGPDDNVRERRRLQQAVAPAFARLELWVRTTDQYEEARQVIGCVEYLAATQGIVTFSREPSRCPVARRSREEIRNRNVCDLLADARRMLCAAVRTELATGAVPSSADDGNGLRAWRSIQHAISAVCAWGQTEVPAKSDDVEAVIAKLVRADTGLARKLGARGNLQAATAAIARSVLRDVAACLFVDSALRTHVTVFQRSIAGPLYELAGRREAK